jgi:hypothetical protein
VLNVLRPSMRSAARAIILACTARYDAGPWMSAQEPFNEYIIKKSSFGAASSSQLFSHHCRANASKAKPLGVATGSSTRTCPSFLHVWSAEVPSKRQAFSRPQRSGTGSPGHFRKCAGNSAVLRTSRPKIQAC